MRSEINFIGIVHSSLKRLEDCPRQEDENGAEVTIEIFDSTYEVSPTSKKVIAFFYLPGCIWRHVKCWHDSH